MLSGADERCRWGVLDVDVRAAVAGLAAGGRAARAGLGLTSGGHACRRCASWPACRSSCWASCWGRSRSTRRLPLSAAWRLSSRPALRAHSNAGSTAASWPPWAQCWGVPASSLSCRRACCSEPVSSRHSSRCCSCLEATALGQLHMSRTPLGALTGSMSWTRRNASGVHPVCPGSCTLPARQPQLARQCMQHRAPADRVRRRGRLAQARQPPLWAWPPCCWPTLRPQCRQPHPLSLQAWPPASCCNRCQSWTAFGMQPRLRRVVLFQRWCRVLIKAGRRCEGGAHEHTGRQPGRHCAAHPGLHAEQCCH